MHCSRQPMARRIRGPEVSTTKEAAHLGVHEPLIWGYMSCLSRADQRLFNTG